VRLGECCFLSLRGMDAPGGVAVKCYSDVYAGRASCHLNASTSTFSDPCPAGTSKYLQVQYTCEGTSHYNSRVLLATFICSRFTSLYHPSAAAACILVLFFPRGRLRFPSDVFKI